MQMRLLRVTFFVCMIAAVLSACATKKPLLPVHDEVLIFDLSYDLVFLRALDAAQKLPGWELELTDKEKGLVVIRNINYSSLVAAEKRIITVVVKRISRGRTSISLAPESQQVLGGGEVLHGISEFMSREL